MATFAGEHRNASRDFQRWLKLYDACECEPDYLDLLVRKKQFKRLGPYKRIRLPVLGPHMVLHALHNRGSNHFRLGVVGPRGRPGVSSYWKNALRYCRFARRHPVVQRHLQQGTLDRLLPGLIHFDGAEVKRWRETLFWSWSVHTAGGNTNAADTKFFVCGLPAGYCSCKRIWRR